jgi:nitrite reductase (NADH) large subunit
MAVAQHLVIVGAGMATAYLLRELARHEHAFRITVIGDEPEVCYNRVMLSGVLAGDSTEADLGMFEAGDGSQALDFITATRVESVDLAKRTLCTDSGQQLVYDRLVMATGAGVACPPGIDVELPGVEELRTLQDTRRLRELCAAGSRAVVLGGGLLGLEAAHGLNSLGFSTTVVHRRGHLMNRQLDEEGGCLLRRKMEATGVQFVLDAEVESLHSVNDSLTGLTLGDGQCLPSDILVIATGIAPRTDLARQAGLAVERGVLVDEYMRSSDAHCYALGECSQLGQQCFGLVAPIVAQAKVLARQLLGIEGEAYVVEDWPTQLKISGIDIFSAGDPGAAGDELVMRDAGAGVYRRLVLREGRLVSAVLVGDKHEGSWYRELISSAQDISGIRSTLMFGRKVSESMLEMKRAA